MYIVGTEVLLTWYNSNNVFLLSNRSPSQTTMMIEWSNTMRKKRKTRRDRTMMSEYVGE